MPPSQPLAGGLPRQTEHFQYNTSRSICRMPGPKGCTAVSTGNSSGQACASSYALIVRSNGLFCAPLHLSFPPSINEGQHRQQQKGETSHLLPNKGMGGQQARKRVAGFLTLPIPLTWSTANQGLRKIDLHWSKRRTSKQPDMLLFHQTLWWSQSWVLTVFSNSPWTCRLHPSYHTQQAESI